MAEGKQITLKRAYIHEYGQGKLEPEHRDVAEVLAARGIPYELFTIKRLMRNQLPLDRETLLVGDHAVIAMAMKRLGFNETNDCYPKSLEKYLGRRVWSTTIRGLLSEAKYKNMTDIFVKPRSKAKLFTGFVLHSNRELWRLDSFSGQTELYCSTLVEWVSEWRVFVSEGRIVGVRNYSGDEGVWVDMEVVEAAVRDLEASDERTAGYAIDFGVLESGETTLVEWNDGFALGSYGLDKDVYTDLLIARWEEVLGRVFG